MYQISSNVNSLQVCGVNSANVGGPPLGFFGGLRSRMILLPPPYRELADLRAASDNLA